MGAADKTLSSHYRYTRKVTLPGITVRLLKGGARREGDMPFMGSLYIRFASARL